MNIYTKVAEITNESVKDYKNHADKSRLRMRFRDLRQGVQRRI